MRAAASILNESWVGGFEKSAKLVSPVDASAVVASLAALKAAAAKGDAPGAKKAFVASASAVADWASAAGVTSVLKGL